MALFRSHVRDVPTILSLYRAFTIATSPAWCLGHDAALHWVTHQCWELPPLLPRAHAAVPLGTLLPTLLLVSQVNPHRKSIIHHHPGHSFCLKQWPQGVLWLEENVKPCDSSSPKPSGRAITLRATPTRLLCSALLTQPQKPCSCPSLHAHTSRERKNRDGLSWQCHPFESHLLGEEADAWRQDYLCILADHRFILSLSILFNSIITFPFQDFKYVIMTNISLKTILSI